MITDETYFNQTKAKIDQWNHERIELEARVAQGAEDAAQLQISKQRIIELKSQIEAAQKLIEGQSS
jgi:hypothetical protein